MVIKRFLLTTVSLKVNDTKLSKRVLVVRNQANTLQNEGDRKSRKYNTQGMNKSKPLVKKDLLSQYKAL